MQIVVAVDVEEYSFLPGACGALTRRQEDFSSGADFRQVNTCIRFRQVNTALSCLRQNPSFLSGLKTVHARLV